MKKILKGLFAWLFSEELESINSKVNKIDRLYGEMERTHNKFLCVMENIDVSVDVHHYSRSWACISLQGKQDFIKFIDLGDRDIREISRFLSQFDRNKVDANPCETRFLRHQSKSFRFV